MSTNTKRYEDFINQKNKMAQAKKEQTEFLRKCKSQNLTKDFYEICEALLIENDKQNIKNLKAYLLSDKFQKFAYERILKFDIAENENPKSENSKSQNDQFSFGYVDDSKEELGLF